MRTICAELELGTTGVTTQGLRPGFSLRSTPATLLGSDILRRMRVKRKADSRTRATYLQQAKHTVECHWGFRHVESSMRSYRENLPRRNAAASLPPRREIGCGYRMQDGAKGKTCGIIGGLREYGESLEATHNPPRCAAASRGATFGSPLRVPM